MLASSCKVYVVACCVNLYITATVLPTAMISHPPIPIERLAEHIDALKTSDNFKFSQEYESIEPGQQFTWDNR